MRDLVLDVCSRMHHASCLYEQPVSFIQKVATPAWVFLSCMPVILLLVRLIAQSVDVF